MISKLTLIIPCFNEEQNLERFERDVFGALSEMPFQLEYLLVDDGSKDGTFRAMESLAQQHRNVRVIRHDQNRGLGAALRSGFAEAAGDAIATLDADLTFHPSFVRLLIEKMTPDVDCVIGSPILGDFRGVPFVRRLLSLTVNRIYRRLLPRPITATSSIFRLYRTSTLRRLVLFSDSFDINGEIVFKLLMVGAHIAEVPVRLTLRKDGVSKINVYRETMNHLRMFARIIRWRMTRRPTE